jgi:hypothetical protein
MNSHFGVQRLGEAEETVSKIVESGEWTGGVLVDTEFKPLLTILGFCELEN